MLVGFCGKMGAGKDTAYERLKYLYQDDYSVSRVSFADALKKSICGTLGITRDMLENYKRDPDALITLTYQGEKIIEMTFRAFTQRVGTEGGRQVFGTDFWVDFALPEDFSHHRREKNIVAVTDGRFENELSRIRELGGKLIYLTSEEDAGTFIESGHESETYVTAAMCDAVVENTKRGDEFFHLDNELRCIVERWVTCP